MIEVALPPAWSLFTGTFHDTQRINNGNYRIAGAQVGDAEVLVFMIDPTSQRLAIKRDQALGLGTSEYDVINMPNGKRSSRHF